MLSPPLSPEPQAYASGLAPAAVARADGSRGEEALIEEVPVSLVFNDEVTITLMATPLQAEALALGFCLSEGLIERADELGRMEAVPTALGLCVLLQLPEPRLDALRARRRFGVAPGGCGLCGIEDQRAMLALPAARAQAFALQPGAVERALAQLQQPLNAASGGAHAAAFVAADGEVRRSAEDVSRHCALDKLIGLLAQQGLDPASGWLLMSSRASFELVAKAARAGFPLLAAMSAPTALALRAAESAGIELLGFARGDRWSRYTRP